MASSNEERVFPHDPDLEEPAAAALFDEMTAQPAPEPADAEAASSPLAPARRMPVIEPAELAQWQTPVPLQRSLKVDGAVLDTITVRCLTGEEFVNLVMAYGTSEEIIMPEVRAAMCGLHPAVIAALSADDQARVVAACRPFLPLPLQGDPDATDLVASALAATGGWPT